MSQKNNAEMLLSKIDDRSEWVNQFILDLANELERISSSSDGIIKTPNENNRLVSETENILTSYNLNANYPNPFNPSTNISFSLPEYVLVSVKVYDILGKEVADLVNDYIEPGIHTVTFNGSKLASGMYIVNFRAGEYCQSQKILLMK